MSDDTRFTPRLGRIGNRGAASGERFAKRLKRAAKHLSKSSTGTRFSGAQIGRASAAGRAAAFRAHPFAKFRMRRVVVKTHIARAGKAGGPGAYRAHLKYLQRDGVERDGEGGELYSAEKDRIDDKDFLERSQEDRHQFRFIVSPEDASELGDLKETTRALMRQMGQDVGVSLDWVAVDHHNTAHPHTHIVVRGRDGRGRDLIIAREYLTQGLRRRASDLLTERLGPRRDIEIARAKARDVSQDRFTALDRTLAERAPNHEFHIAHVESAADRFERTLLKRRLSHLETLQLASRHKSDLWRLTDGWQDVLKAMGRRGDRIREIAAAHRGADRGTVDIFESDQLADRALIGAVIGDGPENELRNTRYLLVEGMDGKTWHVSVGANEPGALPPRGAIIEITTRKAAPRSSDRTIAAFAAAHGGTYSADAHRAQDAAASGDYLEAHKRRLEALRRGGIVERLGDGSFAIPDDFLTRAARYEQMKGGNVHVAVRSWLSLGQQISHAGPTWLDDAELSSLGASGFGEKIRNAARLRTAYLEREGFVGADRRLGQEARARLAQQELADAVKSAARGKNHIDLTTRGRFDGIYERPVDLGQGRFALVANAKEFVLVPWRPDMERQRGRALTLRTTSTGIDWSIGKTRGLSR